MANKPGPKGRKTLLLAVLVTALVWLVIVRLKPALAPGVETGGGAPNVNRLRPAAGVGTVRCCDRSQPSSGTA